MSDPASLLDEVAGDGDYVVGRTLTQGLAPGEVLDGVEFEGCRFVDCTALAVAWTRAAGAALSARPWDFDRCRLDLGSFQEGAIAGSRLIACSLREVDLSATDAQRVDFAGSDLAGAVFVDTDLRGASLVGAEGYTFDPAQNRVRGLRVETASAVGLLAAMGMVVDP